MKSSDLIAMQEAVVHAGYQWEEASDHEYIRLYVLIPNTANKAEIRSFISWPDAVGWVRDNPDGLVCLRAALEVEADPAAASRAVLEQWVGEHSDNRVRTLWPSASYTYWTVCIEANDGAKDIDFDALTEAEALVKASAHVETLRQPKVPEPETMTAYGIALELERLGYVSVAQHLPCWDGPRMIPMFIEGEDYKTYMNRALREARAAAK